MDYKNPEGYADPTAYYAMKEPAAMPGDIWAVTTMKPGEERVCLFLQVFDEFGIVLNIQNIPDNIPSGCSEKVLYKARAGFVDISKPQVVFFKRLIQKDGTISLTRLIDIRQKAADIILRGYPQDTPRTRLEAPRTDSKPELDKIPTETEKPQETARNTQETDAEIAVLKFKAAMNEALAGRLLDIVEKAVQKGA